jgi:hypothetical protein
MTHGTCTVDGCTRRWMARGLCNRHYQAAQQDGTLRDHDGSRPATVLGQTAADHGVTVVDLLGRSRGRALVAARTDAAHRLRSLGWSTTDISHLLGGRHHTTILHALAKPQPDVPRRPQPVHDRCTVPGCVRHVDKTAMGLCGGHYMRWQRDGDIRQDVPLRAARTTVLDLEVHDRHGYRDGCGCDVCRRDAVLAVKRSRHRPLRVNVEEGRRALEAAVARGWSIPKIAAAVGVYNGSLYAWLHGRVDRVSGETVAAVEALGAVPGQVRQVPAPRPEPAEPSCEDCGAPSLAGGRWCLDHYQANRPNAQARRAS